MEVFRRQKTQVCSTLEFFFKTTSHMVTQDVVIQGTRTTLPPAVSYYIFTKTIYAGRITIQYGRLTRWTLLLCITLRSLVSQQEEPVRVEVLVGEEAVAFVAVFADGETVEAADVEAVHDSSAVLDDSIVVARAAAADDVPLEAKAVEANDVAEPSEGVPTAGARVAEALAFEQRPAETDKIRLFKSPFRERSLHRII